MADKEFKLGIVIDSSGAIKGVEDATGAFVEFNQALDETQGNIKGYEKSTDDAGEASEDLGGSLDVAFKAATALNQALELGKKIMGAVGDVISRTTEAYSVQELAETGVANALKITGQFTEDGLQGWKDWASALQNVTTTGDEFTLGLVKTATTMGLNEEQTKTLIKASIDLGEATGKGTNTAFQKLLGTYGGTATSLRRLGIDTSHLTEEQIKNGDAVQLVAKKFEGLAEAQTKTFTGAQIQAANAFGDVVEEVGKLFVEVLGLADSGHRMTQFWVDVGAAVSETRVMFLEAKEVVQSFLDLPWSKLKNATIMLGVLTAVMVAYTVATGTASAATLAFIANLIAAGKAALASAGRFALLAAKALLIAAGVATVILSIDLLIRNLENLPNLLNLVWNVFQKAVQNMGAVFLTLLGEMASGLAEFARDAGLDSIGDSIGNAAANISEAAARKFDLAGRIQKKIDRISGDVDTGFAGDLAGVLNNAINGVKLDPIKAPDVDKGTAAIKDATVAMGALGQSAVAASTSAKEAIQSVRATAAEIANAIGGIKTDAEGVRINVFGNSFEKAQQNIKVTAEAYSQAAAVFVEKGDVSAASVDKVSTALKAVQTAEAQAKALRLKTIEDVVSKNQQATADLLKSSGDIVKAVEIENNIKLKALEKEHEAILKNLDLSDREKKALTDQIKLQQMKNDVALKGAQDAEKKAAVSGPGSNTDSPPIVQFADAGQLQALQDSFGAATSATVGAMGGAASAMMGAMSGIFAAMDVISGIMKAVLSIPDKFTDFFNALTDFGPMLADGIQNMFNAFTRLVSDLVPNLIDAITDILASIGDFLGDALPDAFESLAEKIPEALMKFIQSLPTLVQKLAKGFIRLMIGVPLNMMISLVKALPMLITAIGQAIPDIVDGFITGIMDAAGEVVTAFVDFFLAGGAEKVGKAIIMALANLPSIIGRGLMKAFKKMFIGIEIPQLKVPEALTSLPEKLKGAAQSIGDGIKAGGGDVFALVDIAKSKSAKTIDSSIGEATKKSAALFKQTFKTVGGWLAQLWRNLKIIWDFIVGFLNKLWQALKVIWDVVIAALKILWDAIKVIWDAVILALQTLWDAIKVIWDAVILALQTLWDAIELIWDGVVLALQTLWTAIETIWDAVVLAVQTLWDNIEIIWDAVVLAVQTLWDNVEKIFDDFVSGIQGVWDWFKTNILDKFSSGVKEVFDAIPEQARLAAENLSGAITKMPEQARQAAEKLAGAISALPGKASEFATNVVNKLAGIGTTMWNSFTSAFGNMGGVIKGHATWAFDELFRNIRGAFGKIFEGVGGGGKGTIENLMNADVPILNFAGGGIVPGTATVPGNSIKNDTVAALLSPGEVVVPRSILADPEIARLVQSIMEGNVNFAFGGIKAPKIKISAPKLPTINDVKSMSTADLAKNLEANFEALKKLATGDLWDMFKDKIFNQVKIMMEGVVKSAAGFETGGMVPNTGIATVHQNEAVLPSELVNKIMGNNDNRQSQNITLNATVNMVGADVSGGKQSGKKIIDEMFVELRKRSANQKVMFQSGLIA